MVAVKVTAWPEDAGLAEELSGSPLYTAVMQCVPLASAAVVKVACIPARVPLSDAVPSTVLPSRKVTVPVGVAAPAATPTTVAVKLRAWPAVVESAEGDSEVRL